MAKKKKTSSFQTVHDDAPPKNGNFWTPLEKRTFYEAVAQLSQKSQTPDGATQGYRHLRRQHRDGYVLSVKQELQLADDIALAFPWEDRAETVTACTLTEHDEGRRLVICLGINDRNPPQLAIEDFRNLMWIVENYASQLRNRVQARQELLARLVEIRSRRILQRLQSPNGGKPPRGRITQPLHERLAKKIAYLKTTHEYGQLSKLDRKAFGDICLRIESLLKVYREVDRCEPNMLQTHLQSAVLASYEISTQNHSYSLVRQLKDLGFRGIDVHVNQFYQVDKIGHYSVFSTNILRLARRHPDLFSKIEVKICPRPDDSKPLGSQEICHVHGEVQLVLHHERAMFQPKPRCIGSSKSLCYLCGLFLEKHGGFWVSYCHKRLYHKWSIPDTDWMDQKQALRFQQIVRVMTSEVVRVLGLSNEPLQHPVLSRCNSPFSTATSTASNASIASADSDATIRPAQVRSGSLTPVSEWQPDSIEGWGKQTTSPTLDRLSGSTTMANISAEPTCFSARSELPAATETRPPSVMLIPPSTPPSTLAARDLSSARLPSSPLPLSPIVDSSPSLPHSPLSLKLSRLNLVTVPRSSSTDRIESSPSICTTTILNLPQTHMFHSKSLDIELKILKTLFIFKFDFETTAVGTLMLSRINTACGVGSIHALTRDGICHLINAADMGREIVCLKREQSSCEFAIGIDEGEAMRVVVVVWEGR